MSKLSKEEFAKFKNTEINVYIGFSDLSEDEYEYEKRRLFYEKDDKKDKNKKEKFKKENDKKILNKSIERVPIKKELDKKNNNLLSQKRKKENYSRSPVKSPISPSKSMLNNKITPQKKKLVKGNNLKEISKNNSKITSPTKIKPDPLAKIDKQVSSPKKTPLLPPEETFHLPVKILSSFPIIESKAENTSCYLVRDFIRPQSTAKSFYEYQTLLSMIRPIPLKSLSSNKKVFLDDISLKYDNKTIKNTIIINLSTYPAHLKELKDIVPNMHYPKSKFDILKYSPTDISGINVPRLMIIPPKTSLSKCFRSQTVQFRRYFLNFGPGTISHIVIPKSQISPVISLIPQGIPTDKFRKELTDNKITFYEFDQLEGDACVVEPGSIHYIKTGSDPSVITNWSIMKCDLSDLVHDIEQSKQRKIPLITLLVKLINSDLFDIEDPIIVKLCIEEISKYLKENNDLNKLKEEFYKERIGLIKQIPNLNANFCDICGKEILNYYSVVGNATKLIIFCLNCYCANYSKGISSLKGKNNKMILYKFEEKDIDLLFKRMIYFLTNIFHIKDLKLSNNEDIKKYMKPQECFLSVTGDEIKFETLNKIQCEDDFVFTHPSANGIDEIYLVSKFLIPLVDKDQKRYKVFDYQEISKQAYTDYENVGGDGNEARFSPRYQPQRKFSDDDEGEVITKGFKKPISRARHIFSENSAIFELFNKSKTNKDEKAGTKDNDNSKQKTNGIYQHLKGQSFTSFLNKNTLKKNQNGKLNGGINNKSQVDNMNNLFE